MKKRIAILICLFSITIPVVPVWGRESSELNLTAGATKQIDDILLNDISDFKFGWTMDFILICYIDIFSV